MKRKNKTAIFGIFILIIVIIIAGILAFLAYTWENKDNDTNNGNIGGQTDIHGCLIGAGYSWNESVFACIREWELDSGQRKAANIAILPLSYYVTITEVSKQECEGCYAVKIQRNDNRQMEERIIKNWQMSSNTDGGNDNSGDTGGEGKRTYCTAGQRNAQVCTMEYSPVCGWSDESIKCFKYPCAQTYSNPCMACSNENVAYWTDGECPK